MSRMQGVLSALLLTVLAATQIMAQETSRLRVSSTVPVRPITSGPACHWFGYYDKLQFDTEGRYVLGMETPIENRSPEAGDIIKIGAVDLLDNNRWIELGETRAWNWQQGCMLQWIPGSETDIIWNDRVSDRFVSRIMNVETRQMRTIPWPVYTVSPDGRTAMSTDFRRIQDMRPGYGYAGIPDPNADLLAPEDTGIWRVDLITGKAELVISIADVAAIPFPGGDISTGKHYFNHLLFNTDGSRFIFLHRWRMPGAKSWNTRMLTAAPDGSDIRVIDDNGMTSHFIWRDAETILAWSRHEPHGARFYLFSDDGSGEIEVIGKEQMTRDGHCTYLPGGEWILNDSYPDKERMIGLYLFNVATEQRIDLGRFYLAPEYTGEWRVDTHPRFSRDGRYICFDSAWEGYGRQMYLLDIGEIVGK